MIDETAPEGTAHILVVPLDRLKTKKATYYLREMDEETEFEFRSMVNVNKTYDGVRHAIKRLSLKGSDDVSLLKGKDILAIKAASNALLEIFEPLEAELKKNY